MSTSHSPFEIVRLEKISVGNELLSACDTLNRSSSAMSPTRRIVLFSLSKPF